MVFLKQHREFTLDAELFVISLYNENEAIWADKNVYGIMQFELLQRKLFVNASYLYLQPDSQDTHLLNLFEKCAIEFSKSKIIESMDLDKLLHEKLYGKNLTYAQTEEEYQQLYIEALLTSIQQRQASVTKMARKMVSLNDTEAKLATILELFSSDIFFDVDRLIPLFATVNFSPIFYALQSLLCMGCTFGTTTSFLSMNIIIIEHIRDGLKSIAKKDEEVNLLLQTSSTLAGKQ